MLAEEERLTPCSSNHIRKPTHGYICVRCSGRIKGEIRTAPRSVPSRFLVPPETKGWGCRSPNLARPFDPRLVTTLSGSLRFLSGLPRNRPYLLSSSPVLPFRHAFASTSPRTHSYYLYHPQYLDHPHDPPTTMTATIDTTTTITTITTTTVIDTTTTTSDTDHSALRSHRPHLRRSHPCRSRLHRPQPPPGSRLLSLTPQLSTSFWRRVFFH